MVAINESKVGKFRMRVKESTTSKQQFHDRAEVIAAWLYRQWQQEKEASLCK